MSFVTLTIQRLLNLYRRTGCAGKCVSIKKYQGLKSYFLSASGAGDHFRRFKNGDLLAFLSGSFTNFNHIQ